MGLIEEMQKEFSKTDLEAMDIQMIYDPYYPSLEYNHTEKTFSLSKEDGDVQKIVEHLMDDHYRSFVKALISYEKGIEEDELLDEIYLKFMKVDVDSFLHDFFDDEISKLELNEDELEL